MILIIAFLFIIILGSGIVSLGLEDYKRMREERGWVGWQFRISKFNMFLYKIGL